jgi:hypothetical protein
VSAPVDTVAVNPRQFFATPSAEKGADGKPKPKAEAELKAFAYRLARLLERDPRSCGDSSSAGGKSPFSI